MQNSMMWLFIFVIALHLRSVYTSKADFPLHVLMAQDLEIPAVKMVCPNVMRLTAENQHGKHYFSLISNTIQCTNILKIFSPRSDWNYDHFNNQEIWVLSFLSHFQNKSIHVSLADLLLETESVIIKKNYSLAQL